MKVVHINTFLARKGGAETYLLSLIPLLHERDIEQQFIYGVGEPDLHEGALQVPNIGEIGFRREKRVTERVAEILENEKPDIIHIHNVENFGVYEASLTYGPTIFTTHDYRTICPASMMYYRWPKEVCHRHSGPGCFSTTLRKHCLTPRPQYASYFYHRTQWILKNAHRFSHVITPSESVRHRFVKAGFNEHNLTVLPYYCSIEPREAPRSLPEKATISFIGRIADNKGYQYFVEALGQLPTHVQGVMVGNFTPQNKERTEQLAAKHNCADRLTLHPWASKDEIISLLDATSILVFPSLYAETLGIIGLEAFSRGVPVVASDIGGVRQWLTHGENGMLVKPKSSAHIRDAVLQLLSDKEALLNMGRNGISSINEYFRPDYHTDKLVQLYEQVAVSNRRLVLG